MVLLRRPYVYEDVSSESLDSFHNKIVESSIPFDFLDPSAVLAKQFRSLVFEVVFDSFFLTEICFTASVLFLFLFVFFFLFVPLSQ